MYKYWNRFLNFENHDMIFLSYSEVFCNKKFIGIPLMEMSVLCSSQKVRISACASNLTSLKVIIDPTVRILFQQNMCSVYCLQYWN